MMVQVEHYPRLERSGSGLLSQFRVSLVSGQLPQCLFPSAQSSLCILDFLSVILHLSYLYFDRLLADAIFYYVFMGSTRMSLDSIVIEMVILYIVNALQLPFAFFSFSREKDLDVSMASFLGRCKHFPIFPPAQKPKQHFALWDRQTSAFPIRFLLPELLSIAGQYFTSIYVPKDFCKSQLCFTLY